MQGDIDAFLPEQSKAYGEAQKNMQRSRNKQLREIFDDGFAVHHAGMLRADRHLVEKCFVAGHIRVLVCTATLAWGVNLPAHAVVIKGTELYDATKGSFVDLSMLDILQVRSLSFPQFCTCKGRLSENSYTIRKKLFVVLLTNKRFLAEREDLSTTRAVRPSSLPLTTS